MGILKRARVVLACAALAAPFAAAAVALPAPALASAVSPHHAAGPDTTGCIGGKAVESAELNPGAHGMVLLCYNINNRHTWAKVYTTGLPACAYSSGQGPGCGTAEVINTRGASASCNIPQNGTSCTTGEIDDADITSVAEATVLISCTHNGCTAATGKTSPY